MSLPKDVVHHLLDGQYAGRKLPTPSALAHHFTCLGVPYRLSRKLSYYFYKWYRSEGAEAFNKRIKDLLTELLTGARAPWIKRAHGMSWVLWDLRSLPFRVRVRVLRVNTFLILGRVTTTQERKFFGSLAAKPVSLGLHCEWLDSKDLLSVKALPYVAPSFEDYLKILSKERNLPRLGSDGSLEVRRGGTDYSLYDYHKYLEYHDSLGHSGLRRNTPYQMLLRERPQLPKTKMYTPNGIPSWPEDLRTWSPEPEKLPIGRISPIQEPGCKLRAVANPVPFYQWALKPLGDVLFDILKQLPRDYTHNQEGALPVIRDWIREVKSINSSQQDRSVSQRLYSVDLSDATNTFPLEYQLEVLRFLLPREYAEQVSIFEHASRGEWELSRGFHTKGRISWTKGQPLGLYPSFASFALSHYALLDGLRAQSGGDFCIVGDDVVIKGEALFNAYVKALSDLEIPWSREKSMASPEMAEFVGSIIRSSGWFKKGKEGPITAQSALSRVFKHGESEFQYMRKLVGGSLAWDRGAANIARALFVYDCYPTYLGGGGHVDFNVTKLIPDTRIPTEQRRHAFPGLAPWFVDTLLKKLSDSLPPLWRKWTFQSMLPDALRSDEGISNIPTIPRKGGGKKLIDRVVKGADETERGRWIRTRFRLGQ